MAFYYDLRLPEELVDCKLVAQIVAKGSCIEANSVIAIIENNEGRSLLRNAGPGVLSGWFICPGEAIAHGDQLARMLADGEDIPYGKPYLIVERE
jgi:hypothetical protein